VKIIFVINKMGNTCTVGHYTQRPGCWKKCDNGITYHDVPCESNGGMNRKSTTSRGGAVDEQVNVSSGTYSVHVDDAVGTVSINGRVLNDEQMLKYIQTFQPIDPTTVDVVSFNNRTYYVLKSIKDILQGGGASGARKTKKSIKASKSTKTTKKVKASWSPVGKNVKITLPNGNVRSLYKNPDKPGELRIRKMVAAKDGSGTGTVAKYVKPPTNRTNKGRK
jgi:hypothetical protein